MRLFGVTDIGFAATLLHYGYAVQDIEWRTEKRATFIFNNDGRIKDLQDDYYKGKLEVEPFSYNMNLKDLKSRLHNGRDKA